ncbi:hypothetical protein B0A53_06484 [Rhodotorula sp. CCFEE 5036]|nr:hypothetical protein B0A53_06484 [Rhodotorula sp. CCFEE 5036]
MPNGFPVPPIPPTPPSFLLQPQSATSPQLPTMTPLPPPPIPPVPPSFTHNVVAASIPPASPHSDTGVSSVSPPPRIASPAASTATTPGPDNLDSLKHSYGNSDVSAPVLEAVPVAGGETGRAPLSGTGEPRRSGGQLRRVILPAKLISHFVDIIAEANTARKIETCGLLLGKERDHELVISHLLIPQQSGTSETCSMQREEEVAAFQQKESLLTFGWIHTHPTQSIFLSSLDLHTHASYQRLLPEAIAVVCAPHEGPNAYGVFRMTDPPGLEIVLECQDEGAFHLHYLCTQMWIKKEGTASFARSLSSV